MKKFLGIAVLGLLFISIDLSNSTTVKAATKFDPEKAYGKVTWWDETVWFFEDLFESSSNENEKDKKIKQLENRVKYLERNQTSAEKNERKIQAIRDCLMADLDTLMCAGID